MIVWIYIFSLTDVIALTSQSRYNSRVYADELVRSFGNPASGTLERLTANQPIPGAEVDEEFVDVMIDDLAQTITIRNEQTGQVRDS